MSKQKSKEAIRLHCKQSLESLSCLLDNTLESQDPMLADKLAYWIEDYSRFLKIEKEIVSFHHYKRGDVVKAHLGFRVGSEEGGLHYCVVLSDSGPHQPVLHVVPLTSQKISHTTRKLPRGSILLGIELYNSMVLKSKSIYEECRRQMEDLDKETSREIIVARIPALEKRMKDCEKVIREIQRMKYGSIALVNQIVTISKIRILDPRGKDDNLMNIKLSETSLDKIDAAIIQLFTKQK